MSSFRDALRKILTKKEQSQAIYGFDVLGDMALIEIPELLQKKKRKIAHILLDTQKNLTRVYEKIGDHSGKYRLEKIKWLAGKKDSLVHYKEWGCVFHFDPGTVFFNPRLSTERQRIAEMIGKNQTVCVFFAGVGPYPIQIAKHTQGKKIYALEWNPAAKPFFILNAAQNKVSEKIHFIQGDVNKIPTRGECDHVILPAPETAIEYIPAAIRWLSPKGGLIHLYLFAMDPDAETHVRTSIHRIMHLFPYPAKITYIRKVSDFSPTKRQFCVGIRVSPARFKKKKTTRRT